MSISTVAGPAAAPAPAFTPDRPTQPSADSPIVRSVNSTKTTVEDNDADSQYMHLAKEIEKHLVGPMPVVDFLRDYLLEARTEAAMPSSEGAFAKVPLTGTEPQLSEPLSRAFNKDLRCRCSLRCPTIKFFHTGNKGEMLDKDKHGIKIDICGYLEGDGVGDDEGRCMPGLVQIFAELKLHDFACDDPGPGKRFLFGHITNEKELGYAIRALGQQVWYATEICARQHRNFLFSIFLTATRARFLRWDRAGVIVSESFDYRQEPEILCDFLWRFGHMSDAQRGCDTTVQWATMEEEELFKEAIQAHVKSQLGANYLTLDAEYERHYEPKKVVKITVWKTIAAAPVDGGVGDIDPNATGKRNADMSMVGDSETVQDRIYMEKMDFLVSRPVASPTSLASRATRGYWAVPASDAGSVQFLKDAWRTDVAGMEIEGVILESLENEAVQNVPTLVCFGDVKDRADSECNRTMTDQYKFAPWNKHQPEDMKGDKKGLKLTPRVHYRQVIEEAGYTLEQLAGTHELLSGARDVLYALHDAHNKCNRLHRDVSSSNIILLAHPAGNYKRRKALLIDWELSCVDVASEARDHYVSGTWAFMSVATLRCSRGHHFCDDVESLFYVIFYCAILCLEWTNPYNPTIHSTIIKDFFDQQYFETTGGVGKLANMPDGMFVKMAAVEHITKMLQTARRSLIKTWNLDQDEDASPAPLPDVATIFKLCSDIFEGLDWEDISDDNRDYHPRPYKGPPQDSHPATMSSSQRPKGSSKRGRGAVDKDSTTDKSSKKRPKTDEAANNAVAGPSNAGNKGP